MDIVRRKLTLVTSIGTLNTSTSTSTSKNETTLARKADKESTKILFRAWLITYNGYETRKITFSCVLSDHHRLCSLSNRRRQVILSGSSKQKMETIVFVFVFLAGFYNRCPTYLFFPNHTSRYVCEDSWEEPLFDHSLVCRSSSPDQNKVWIHKQHCETDLQHLSKKVFIRKALGQQRGVSRTFLTIK